MMLIRAAATLIAVHAGGRAAARQQRRLWSRCLDEGLPHSSIHLPASRLPLSEAMSYRLAAEIVLRAITDGAGRAVMLHAAAVTRPDGRAVVLVAQSGMGKTTASLTLCRSGYGYLTDELAVLDGTDVLGFRKPLCLVDGRSDVKAMRGPDGLGLAVGPDRAPLGAIALLERRTLHAGGPAFDRLAGLDALLALLPHACALPSLSLPLEELASLCRVPVFRAAYAEADDLVGPLARVDVRRPSVAAWEPLHPGTAGSGWRRAPGVRGVRVGDRGLLLSGDVPVELGPLGVTLWEGMDDGLTLDQATDLCVARHGESPQPRAMVTAALRRLAEAGAILPP